MIITTRSLDRAAFFSTFGAQLLEIQDKYPNNRFKMSVPNWVAWYERAGGFIPYNKFCNRRRHIKRKCRKHANLPMSFVGDKDTGFKLCDLLLTPVVWGQKIWGKQADSLDK